MFTSIELLHHTLWLHRVIAGLFDYYEAKYYLGFIRWSNAAGIIVCKQAQLRVRVTYRNSYWIQDDEECIPDNKRETTQSDKKN